MKDYELETVCSNCGRNGNMSIPKGQKVSDTKCPRCDCEMLRKVDKPTL